MPAFASPNASLVLAALLLAAMPLMAGAAEPGGSIVRIGPSGPAASDAGGAGSGERDSPPATASTAPKDCVGRYLSALQTIRKTEFAAVSGKPGAAPAGDLSLPGLLVFTPKPAPRSRTEMAALATASALAKGRGRPAPGPDARWVAERLHSDLSDYLGQKPTPYLCGGVPQYIETLRRFAARAGTNPQRLQALLAAQNGAALRSIDAALAATKPVATPRFAPADRPAEMLDTVPTGAIAGLRPSAGLSRAETTAEAAKPAPVESDPDLPPLPPPRSLATPADRVAAIDALLGEMRRAGFLAPAVTDEAPGITVGEPVLQRLLAAREALRADPMEPGEESPRQLLASAFADIEALDYLDRAVAEKGDPQSRAVDATFDAILAAQQKECTCGG